MTSSTFPSRRLPAALLRRPAMSRTATPVRTTGRHSAPESADVADAAATDQDRTRPGRHAEPDWVRQLFDPARDEVDPLDWLGFQARQD